LQTCDMLIWRSLGPVENRAVPSEVRAEALGEMALKGLTRPIDVFRLTTSIGSLLAQ
jgi:class 3 adenylate cyclase